MKSNLPMALNKAEILSEMESLVVLGGKDDGGDTYAVLSQCKPTSNTYCDGAKCGYCAYCVESCGGKTPTPGSTLITGELIP